MMVPWQPECSPLRLPRGPPVETYSFHADIQLKALNNGSRGGATRIKVTLLTLALTGCASCRAHVKFLTSYKITGRESGLLRASAKISATALMAFGLVVGVSTSAQAATLTTSRGKMEYGTHNGGFPDDHFTICDTNADGHGVTGYVKHHHMSTGSTITDMKIDDGGDPGCDGDYMELSNVHNYWMEIWWNGRKIASKSFDEEQA
ncbi:hypothetical protein IM697_06505 [Streptomyces ferrugineus]|uniref:Uncharacterized protein n=1 Tax=Streptomyces ferrugineus TaxID=1413221 RepID=A0A7M2SNU9_9ACTN|nr:hypothetical protein [Streptomyces ferrugineus]QOV38047.1 hypothetical protein IM697_06505 [Streptomyces ferrugineus]